MHLDDERERRKKTHSRTYRHYVYVNEKRETFHLISTSSLVQLILSLILFVAVTIFAIVFCCMHSDWIDSVVFFSLSSNVTVCVSVCMWVLCSSSFRLMLTFRDLLFSLSDCEVLFLWASFHSSSSFSQSHSRFSLSPLSPGIVQYMLSQRKLFGASGARMRFRL